MRSVSFVEHIEFEFSGNLFNEALLLEDIDNDGNNELVLGNVNGELFVFKGISSKPWRVSKQGGMITCIGAGDLWNKGKKLLVSLTADGWCHVFDVESQPGHGPTLKPAYSQLLPSNAKTLLIADIDGDGQCELVTGHTDRVVHVHRWKKEQEKTTVAKCFKAGDHPPQDTTKDSSPLSETKPAPSSKPVTGKQRNISSVLDPPRKPSQEPRQVVKEAKQTKNGSEGEEHSMKEDERIDKKERGQFVAVKNWTLSSQITSLVLFKSANTQYLLVSQPGGSFVNLMTSDVTRSQESNESKSKDEDTELGSSDFPFPFLSGNFNPSIPTTMVALSPKQTKDSNNDSTSLLALGLLDGDLSLLDRKQILWTLHLEQNLFSLSKLDITSDGYEEIITCAWDGATYIIDSNKNMVKFQFRENVMAFGVGYYGISAGKNVPCLVYLTFCNSVVIYWNICISRMTPASLLTVMEGKEEGKKTLNELGVMNDDIVDDSKFQELCSKCLYGRTT